MATVNCAEVGNRHLNRAGSSGHPAICSNVKGAADRADDFSGGGSLLPAWRKLVFLKLRIWNSCCRGLLGLLSVVPSGTSHLCPTFPARKRWAKIVRPSGARRYSCAVLKSRSPLHGA